MNNRTAFLRTIATHRFDHLARLVYADWLDEQSNDADAATAEFIRVGVELAGGANQHRPAASCDCERCKLVRRQTELFDGMAHASLIIDSDYMKAGFIETFSPAQWSGGLPAIFHGGTSDLPAMPLAVGRVFLTLPINLATVDFHLYGGRPVRRVTWRIAVGITGATSARGQRITANVGPIVGQTASTTFSCEYPVSHPARVPTLVRKAVRRCLTNRESNSESLSQIPGGHPRAVPHPVVTVHRRRARR